MTTIKIETRNQKHYEKLPLHLIWKASVRKINNGKFWWGRIYEIGIFIHYWLECKIVWPLQKSLTVSECVKHIFTIWPNNIIPWYMPPQMKTIVHTKACTSMCIAAFFIIAQMLKPPKSL